MARSIHWFRRDLRLSDNPALIAAAHAGEVIPLYVHDEETPCWDGYDYRPGGAKKWWLHHSLAALDDALGGKLLLKSGKADAVLREVADANGVTEIHATSLYEPWEIALEEKLSDIVSFHPSETLAEPGLVTTGSGDPYKVYGPFWKALDPLMPPPPPLDAPEAEWLGVDSGDGLDDWDLLPTQPNWAEKFSDDWTPGEKGATEKLADFYDEVPDYEDRRNLPAVEGTSRLSPHLHMGEISPRQVWHKLNGRKHAEKFLKELAWRDFARSAMLNQPSLGWEEGRAKMKALHYRTGKSAASDLEAWQKGKTGYPIVDAGMRQLWLTGWMHNRVRMLAASFLTKHLLLDWKDGERWFWDTLVDADYGNNSLNWQWIAGTGTASQMFTRIMAPLSQSEKFDAADYIREWVPELSELSDECIHDPSAEQREACGYPDKIVAHEEGRERALEAYRKI